MSSSSIALITGANRGLGFETTRQLLRRGIHVIMACRDTEKGRAAVRRLEQENLHPDFLPLDISNAVQIQAAYDHILQQYGRLDMLINNAAVTTVYGKDNGGRQKNTVLDGDIADFKAVFDINVWGTLQLTRAMIPLLRESIYGKIINISSELGSLQLQAAPSSPIYPVKRLGYNASKTMLNLLTIYLQEVLQDTGITTCVISPGWVKTDMGTQAAWMEVPEGAGIIVEAAMGMELPQQFFTHGRQLIPW